MMTEALATGLQELGLDLEAPVQQQLCRFAQAVLDQNQVMNLTAITDPDQVARLHLVDSLTVLKTMDLAGKRVIDVGCGAGFPGVPLKIACPRMELTLLDSLGKRVKWLQSILPQLGVEARCVAARAEEAVSTCRESYDIATSRAVARLNILLELTAPFVKVGGYVLAMKGTAAREELAEAKKRPEPPGIAGGENSGVPHGRHLPRRHRPEKGKTHPAPVPPRATPKSSKVPCNKPTPPVTRRRSFMQDERPPPRATSM